MNENFRFKVVSSNSATSILKLQKFTPIGITRDFKQVCVVDENEKAFYFQNFFSAMSKLVSKDFQRSWLENELFFKPNESIKLKIPLKKLWSMYLKEQVENS